jgi:outer membrane protein, heavy metal efflux system
VLSLENPVVSAMAGIRFNENGSRPFAGTATLAWPVDAGGKRGTRKEAAAAEQQEARLGADEQKRRLLLATLLQHALALRDQQALAIAEARKANTGRVVVSARRRREAGNAPELEVSLAALQEGRDGAAALAAAGERDASLLRLLAMLGLPLERGAAVSGALVPEGQAPELALMLRQTAERVDVRAASARVQAAQARANRERAAGAPTISLLAQYERDDRANIAMLGMAIPLPVLNANSTAKATSAAEVDVAKAEQLVTRREAESDIRELYTRFEATKRAREMLAPTATVAKTAINLAVRGYELGENDLASVLLVHREALEAERALVDVEYAHAAAKLELLVAAGRVPQ